MISIDRLIICDARIEVKSVIVPNTNGLKGIEVTAAAGIAGGQPNNALEVIAQVTPEQREEMHQFLKEVPASIHPMDNGIIFDIIVKLTSGTDARMSGCELLVVINSGSSNQGIPCRRRSSNTPRTG